MMNINILANKYLVNMAELKYFGTTPKNQITSTRKLEVL
jgi:hypothetical protein